MEVAQAYSGPKFKYLNMANFNSIENWSTSFILKNKIGYTNEFVFEKIGNLLDKNKKRVVIKDDVLYSRITVKLWGKGVIERDKEYGKNIGTKSQFLVSSSQFIMSRIDARNGAFGIVPPELQGAITTQDFLTYNINSKKIIPEYFLLITTTEQFHQLCQSASTGTTNRQRINEEIFLSYMVPLPTIAAQRKIVEKYIEKITEADKVEREIQTLESNMEASITECLDIEYPQAKTKSKAIYFHEFSNITRWDVWSNEYIGRSRTYKSLVLRDIIVDGPMYGASVKAIQRKGEIRYIRITDINEDGTLNENEVSAAAVQERFLLKDNDFLIARSGNTVGKTFLYKEKYGKAIFAGYLVKYELDLKAVIPEYLLYYTKSRLFKNWIRSNQRISGQPNINGQEYLFAPIILPPISIQISLVKKVSQMKEKIAYLQLSAANSRREAIDEFEKTIFIN